MLGLSRLAYSLATNRQIPSALGRLHPTRVTPYVLIALAALRRGRARDARATSTSSSASTRSARCSRSRSRTCRSSRLRYREPDRERPYRMPLSIRVRGGALPLPAVLGALLSGAGWSASSCCTSGARYVGLAWMVGGLALYVDLPPRRRQRRCSSA